MTLHNWKTILENWINCYFERPSNSKQKVEIKSLLNIISYLRENLCLDDSKSSLVEAQTLEEFIQEKFPGVVFQNGGVEVTTENELYIVASLLLFFVCVNSKDIDIKNAMCNKLSVNDQETIMKFTKVLMETAVITCKDVENAITEACNDQHVTSGQLCTTVAETPPAIRNMHGEVRRLQAALEAERFDKNFLQEELLRTNHKLEKLTQDKEQYKVDILALKAKISNCCGHESDSQSSNEAKHNASVKLLRQLEEMEERLVDTRSQLDEAVHERNIYKSKVEELKVERNKWINSSQEESTRAAALSQQLEVEHHNNELLKELVADLRQHNNHNVVDTSQLECDDPDVSLQSLGRNMSVCNEVCANVVEVQLSEERAKIVVLQQQINLLQIQLQQLEQTTNEQKTSFENLLLSKDEEIENFKLEIKEGMDRYNCLQRSSSDEIIKLNNFIDELEHKMKDDKEQANIELHSKEQERLTLLEKTNTLHAQLKQLEQTANEQKSSLEHMLLSKDKEIEHLNIEIQKERQYYNSMQVSSNEEIIELKHLVEELNLKMKNNKEQANIELNKKEKERVALAEDMNNLNKQFKQLKRVSSEQKTSLEHMLLTKDEEIENLNLDMQKELKKYNSLQMSSNDEIITLNKTIEELNQKMKGNEEYANRELDKKEKERVTLVEKINMLHERLKQLEQTANEQKSSLEHMLLSKNKEIEHLNIKIQEEVQNYNSLQMSSNEEIIKLKQFVEELNNKMKYNKEQANNDLIKKEKERIERVEEIHILHEQFKQLEQTAREQKSSLEHMLLSKDKEIELLNLDMQKEMKKYYSLKMSSNDEIITLNKTIEELNQKMKGNEEYANRELDKKEKERVTLVEKINMLHERLNQLEQTANEQKSSLEHMLLSKNKEIEHLNIKIQEEVQNYNSLQMSSNEEIIKLKQFVEELKYNKEQANNDLIKKEKERIELVEEINILHEQFKQLEQTAREQKSSLEHMLLSKDKEIELLNLDMQKEMKKYYSLKMSSNDEIITLNKIVDEMNQKIKDNEEQANKELDKKEKERMALVEDINRLNEQLKQLEQMCSEQKTSLEHILLTKGKEIDHLNLELQKEMQNYNTLQISSNEKILKLKHLVEELNQEMKDKKEQANIELNKQEKERVALMEDTNKLNEQLKQLEQMCNKQKTSLQHILLSKDKEIENLNIEIQKDLQNYNSLQISSNEEIIKLTHFVNELKQKIKENEEGAIRGLDKKEHARLTLVDEANILHENIKQLEQTANEQRSLLLSNDKEIENLNLDMQKEINKYNCLQMSSNDEIIKLNKKVDELDQKIKDNEEDIRMELHKKEQERLIAVKESNILHEQLEELEQTANEQKSSLEDMLLSKDNEIDRLKFEVNEGKELYNCLQLTSGGKIDKLKNVVDELKLEIKYNEEETRKKIDNTEQDKSSLLQSFTETSDKLQTQIEAIQVENQRLVSALKEEINIKSTLNEKNNKLIEQLKQLEQAANENISSLENLLLYKDQEIEHLNFEVNEGKELYDCLQISSSDEIDKLKNNVDELKLKMKIDEEEAYRKLDNKEQEKISLLQRFTESTNSLQNKIELMEIENEKLIQELKEEINCKLTLLEETNVLHETLKHIQLNFVGEKTTMSELISKQDTGVKTIILKINEVIEDYNRLKTLSEEEISRLNNYINEVESKKRESDEMILQQEEEITKLQEDLNSKAVLKNDLDILQEQFKQIKQSANEDKKSLLELISRKDKEIESLKQIIKDEVEKQIRVEKSLTNDVSMLNNRVNELGQTIKENQEVTNRDQEEKMLLLEKINELKNEVIYMVTENEELKTELSKNKNLEVIIQENYEVTVKEWNAKVQLLNVELDQWLHSSKESSPNDSKDKINEHCLVPEESVEMTQHDDDKVVCCGDSDINTVVEVQIDTLEKKLKQYQEIANRDKVTLKELLSSKDAEIAKLKCQVRVELEKYISLKESLNDEIKRLHSDISYYEVKLNECEQLAYKELNQKVKDISTLQEDKLTLLKSLTDRIDGLKEKLETIECEKDRLKNDLNKEQNSKLQMQDDYESHITKLNEKISKMSVTENRASQIIKVSAKYQAIILKRVAEIKSNTVLKELTNFGNMPCDNEVRRSLNAGSITMEELESFLETTDKHLRKCSEKQNMLQKERDRLAAVIKINESEIINMKKYLTELSVYFKTFGSVKQVYNQKLSQVVSQQRMVRREILSLEERLSEGALAKLERGYASVLQDLTECAMSFERWVERCISRTVSPEKISLSFTSEHASLADGNFQNSSLESQLDDIEKGFQRLLLDISRAQRGEGSKDAQTMTIMEVKAEYEDKLERMKAKMKQIYQEQTTIFREKQREEVASLEKQLHRARDRLVESSRAYEEHIRGLTSELWNVGEKFLIEKNEADWLKRKCISGSLMSLQQVHSSGLVPPREDKPRPSDTYSLRSLPLHNKSEARTLHMSDEEGEVFDNRWLKELSATPRMRRSPQIGGEPRLSELRYRNSLCPPHLKSSYPAETQFAPTINEEDIKCSGIGGRQRKEVGITAYKKPGPPTPSKQAGRLSATDSELREGLRSEPDTTAPRKTSTPSRIRALFRSSKTLNDNTASPRRRLTIFRNKK